jgi:hypothetical protein
MDRTGSGSHYIPSAILGVLSELRTQKLIKVRRMLNTLVSSYEAACSRACKATSRSKKTRRSGRETDFSYSEALTEVMLQLVKSTTETRRRFNGFKTTHGIVSLFDTSMILLETIIEVLAGPMLDMVPHSLTDCSWIGTVPIGCDRRWCMTNHCDCLPEKPLSCFPIPLLTQHGINQVAIVADGPIQIGSPSLRKHHAP